MTFPRAELCAKAKVLLPCKRNNPTAVTASFLLQAREFLYPRHLPQLMKGHLQTRASDVGEVQIELLGQGSEFPIHADRYAKSVWQAAFPFGCGQEPGQRIIFNSGACGSRRVPALGGANRLRSFRRSTNLHGRRQIEVGAF